MTTTDTDALWDTVHAALTLTPEVRGRIAQEPSRDIRASLRLAAQIDAVLPIIAAEVRKAQADAWDEGCTEGDVSAYHGVAAKPNPYRATEAGGSDEHR